MKAQFILFILTIIPFSAKLCSPELSCNFEEYYNLVSTANYKYQKGNKIEADSCMTLALKNCRGFSNDYKFAIRLKHDLEGGLDTSLLVSLIRSGINRPDFFFFLNKLGYSKTSFFKKLYSKNKPNISLKGIKFARMMSRDQMSRSRNFRWLAKNADSKNAIKLQKLIHKKPHLFDRNNLGWYAQSNLEVLLMHQGNWKDAQKIFYDVRKFVSEGKLPPSILLSMLHRCSMINGASFLLNDHSDSLIVSQNQLLCNDIYYSIFHGNEMRIYRGGIQYLPPFHPDYDTTQINKLRNYIFQMEISLAFPDSIYKPLNAEEYCDFVKLE